MREKEIESYLCKLIKQNKGIALKLISAGMAGIPDRLVLLPKGKIAFVELKAPNKKPRPLQKYTHKLLKELGFKVFVIDSKEGVKTFVEEVIKNGVYTS